MTRNADGIYRWTYELNMYRNPTVLITVLKVLGLSMGLVWLFVVLISMGDRRFWWDGFLSTTHGRVSTQEFARISRIWFAVGADDKVYAVNRREKTDHR